MSRNSFIFIGRSGCGKGTQAALLMQSLKDKGEHASYIETGHEFREFTKGENYTNTKSRHMMEEDLRQPDFLACYMWTKILTEEYSGNEHLVFDGVSRSLTEAQVLDTALEFYGFEHRYVIHLDVSRSWSEKHLLSRGRADDANIERIGKRLDWFDTDVAPAIEYYKASPKYTFISIGGERSIEDVQSDLISNLSL